MGFVYEGMSSGLGFLEGRQKKSKIGEEFCILQSGGNFKRQDR